MSLARLLESKFRGDVRFRGQAYLQAERVSIARVTPDDLHGAVRDGVEFQTHLSRQDGELRMFCSCVGEGQTRDPACKHLWATILATDAGNYLSGTAKAGAIPPFVAETYQPMDFSSWDEEDFEGEAYQPAVSRQVAQETQQRTLRAWESQLQDVRVRMPQAPRTAKTQEARETEIFYEIDVKESRAAKQLVVETSQRQRRSNGQWGKLKPLKLRPDRLDEIAHEDDRRILSFLCGGTPERSGWLAQQAEFQSSVYRYRVSHELCTLLLPLMAQTGHLRYLGDSESEFTPLTWDDGSAWKLALRLERPAEDEDWTLVGEVCREGETLPLNQCQLLLPGGLVLLGQSIARLDDFGAFDWVDLVTGEQRLTAPPGEEKELVDQLLDMPTLPQLDLPPELRLEEVKPEPKPVLTMRSPRSRGWRQERIQGNLQFDYIGTLVRASNMQWAIVQRSEGRCLLRDRDREAEFWGTLQALGFRKLVDHRQTSFDVDIPVTELARAVRVLVDKGWQVQADGKQVRQPSTLKFSVKSDIDWFELNANIDFGDAKINLPELLAALNRGDQTIRLDDGSLGILPEEWLKQYGILAGLGVSEGGGIRFSTSQLGLIDALLATQEFVEVDDRYVEIRERLASFDGVAESKEPEGFQGALRSYQRAGLGWLKFLQEFSFGGCLADDMGLGKTIQMLALLQERKRTVDIHRPSIIVVPKSLMFNWVNELKRFTPELTYMEYTGPERTNVRDEIPTTDVILTTYGTLRRDINELKDVDFDYAVLDEAQTIKNAASQAAKASRLLRARHRLALSGTPIENHLGDLWSIFEFLNPGMLGRSSVFKMHASDGRDEDSRRVIAQGVRPFVLRRTKGQVAQDLPDKVEETIYCEMGTRQRELYLELRDYYRQSLLGMVREQGMGKSKMHVLEALLRLRQAACHPALLDRGSADDAYAKLDVLCPHIEELIEEGHKSLVFSQFTSMLSIVKQHLDARGVRYAYLDGQTRNRKEVVQEFQTDPDVKV
ncbi:MAG: SNF2 helicase associated domain-containing protein, partial [Planctomycetaceae bacterium]|nr:SNF2 helicase associated domain-containing protein [Planctomycetaceae bacterium]